MFRPDDPLAAPAQVFDEPWQAQVLALADAMVKAGRFTAVEWAGSLGIALTEAENLGAPDTLETYYVAVIGALERLCEAHVGISRDDRELRRSAWKAAYLRTPHGQPVELCRH